MKKFVVLVLALLGGCASSEFVAPQAGQHETPAQQMLRSRVLRQTVQPRFYQPAHFYVRPGYRR